MSKYRKLWHPAYQCDYRIILVPKYGFPILTGAIGEAAGARHLGDVLVPRCDGVGVVGVAGTPLAGCCFTPRGLMLPGKDKRMTLR